MSQLISEETLRAWEKAKRQQEMLTQQILENYQKYHAAGKLGSLFDKEVNSNYYKKIR